MKHVTKSSFSQLSRTLILILIFFSLAACKNGLSIPIEESAVAPEMVAAPLAVMEANAISAASIVAEAEAQAAAIIAAAEATAAEAANAAAEAEAAVVQAEAAVIQAEAAIAPAEVIVEEIEVAVTPAEVVVEETEAAVIPAETVVEETEAAVTSAEVVVEETEAAIAPAEVVVEETTSTEVVESAATNVDFVEVTGTLIDPATVTPSAKALGYYKSFDAGRDMTLALLPNGNFNWQVDLHDGTEPIIYIGTWVAGIDTFTVRIAGVENSNEPLSESLLFSHSTDFVYTGQFMGTTVSFYHFKALAAGVIIPALDMAAATTRYANRTYVGTYKAMLVAFDAPGRDATIVLNEDGSVKWTTKTLNREQLLIEHGMWSINEAGSLTLLLTERDGHSQNPARSFTFSLQDGIMHSDKFHASLYALPDLFVGSGSAFQSGNN